MSKDYIVLAIVFLAMVLPTVRAITRNRTKYINSFNECSCRGFINENRDGSICSPSEYCKQHSKRYEEQRKKFNIIVKPRP